MKRISWIGLSLPTIILLYNKASIALKILFHHDCSAPKPKLKLEQH